MMSRTSHGMVKLKTQVKDYQCNVINENIRTLKELSDMEKDKCYLLTDKILKEDLYIGKIGKPSSVAGAIVWLSTDYTQKNVAEMMDVSAISIRSCENKIKEIVDSELELVRYCPCGRKIESLSKGVKYCNLHRIPTASAPHKCENKKCNFSLKGFKSDSHFCRNKKAYETENSGLKRCPHCGSSVPSALDCDKRVLE